MYIANFLNSMQKMQLPLMMAGFSNDLKEEGAMYGDYPVLQVYSNADKLAIRAEVPGLSHEDISLTITDDVLTIAGEIKKNSDYNSMNFMRRERAEGKFQKVLELPTAVDGDNAEAVIKDGILMITLPIRESVKAKQITIKSE